MENKARRRFLQVGIGSGLLLAAGGAIYRSRNPSTFSRSPLDAQADTVLRALIPALLSGALPTEAAARSKAIESALAGTRQAVAGLALPAQKEVADLFGLLALAPARRLLTGLSDDWPQMQTADLTRVLQEWRLHRTQTLQTAYHALHDLVIGPWYGNPDNWAAIGYPGPLPALAG